MRCWAKPSSRRSWAASRAAPSDSKGTWGARGTRRRLRRRDLSGGVHRETRRRDLCAPCLPEEVNARHRQPATASPADPTGLNEASYQIKLYETTNAVQFVYGASPGTGVKNLQIGLNGTTAADFQGRTTATDWNATTASGVNTATCAVTAAIRPVNGLTFTWTSAATVAAMAFTQTSTTYVPIQGAVASTSLTVSGSSYDDTNFGLQTIPFTFNYHGSPFTTLGVQPNGFVQLGAITATGYSAMTTNGNILSPINADLYSAAATAGRNVSVSTIGTTPNRIYVIQWSNWGFYSGGLNEVSFQIRLFETSGVVQYIYGPAPGVNSRTAYVGLTGTTITDFQGLCVSFATFAPLR